MLPIYIRPRTSTTHRTLQARAETWRQAILILQYNKKSAYSGLIEPHVVTVSDDAVVSITFTNNVAEQLLHFFGLTA